MFACLYVPRRPDSDPVAAAASLLALARDFSPRVEVHAPDTVTLDVSGLHTLLGPPRTIGEELRRGAATRGLFVHVAVCASRAAAVVVARARAGLTVVDPGGEADALAPLPLRALEPVTAFVVPTESLGKHTSDHFKGRGEPSPLDGNPNELRRPGLRDAEAVKNAGVLFDKHPALECLKTFRRWGLTTIGDIAALPADAVNARMGAAGVAWHRLACGADPRPLVPSAPDEVFEQTLELEWPIDGLEPLSFVLGRLFDPLCAHLERRDRGIAALHVRLRLVTREIHARRLELPAPIRDARALRTLALLDLESHPPPAAIDVVTVAAEPTPGRVLQYSLLTRALPAAERVSTLVARLGALMGESRIGSPRLIDSYRPGAFEMQPFMSAAPGGINAERAERAEQHQRCSAVSAGSAFSALQSVLRRLRRPIAARVAVEHGRPVRVVTDRRGFGGGRVESCAGPWRSSGEWWHVAAGIRDSGFGIRQAPAARASGRREAPRSGARERDARGGGAPRAVKNAGVLPNDDDSSLEMRGELVPDPASNANDRDAQADYIYALNFIVRESPAQLLRPRVVEQGPIFEDIVTSRQRLRPSPSANARGDSERGWGPASSKYWNVDEWDVALVDGASYRLARDRETDRWYVSGIVD